MTSAKEAKDWAPRHIKGLVDALYLPLSGKGDEIDYDAVRKLVRYCLTDLKHYGVYFVCPERPGYFGHWGSAYKYLASLVGLPAGEYPYSRPPQTPLPEEWKAKARSIYAKIELKVPAR